MKFTLKSVLDTVSNPASLNPTGNTYLDTVYDVVMPSIVGHTMPYYRAFYSLAKKFKPGLVVELGSWRGYAAAHFAAGNPNGQVITIDIHREDKVAQQEVMNVVCPYFQNVQYINGWTWNADVVHEVDNIGKPIDILFIDAWHTYEYAKLEWELYKPSLADHALVIVDDIFDQEGATVDMVKFWDEFDYPKELTQHLHSWIPMGFLEYERTVAN